MSPIVKCSSTWMNVHAHTDTFDTRTPTQWMTLFICWRRSSRLKQSDRHSHFRSSTSRAWVGRPPSFLGSSEKRRSKWLRDDCQRQIFRPYVYDMLPSSMFYEHSPSFIAHPITHTLYTLYPVAASPHLPYDPRDHTYRIEVDSIGHHVRYTRYCPGARYHP